MSQPVFEAAFDSASANAAALSAALFSWGRGQGIPPSVVQALGLILDELVTNIVQHGYEPHAAGPIELRAQRHGNALEVRLRDRGRPFDPLSAPRPDLTADVEHRPIGGLGVHFVRLLADGVAYRQVDGWNELHVSKHWS